MSEVQRLHAIVHGRVQGVSFRYYTQLRAEEIGATGWVRNLEDTSVEVLAEGSKEQLDELLAFLNRGPVGAHVSRVDVTWKSAEGNFIDFYIR